MDELKIVSLMQRGPVTDPAVITRIGREAGDASAEDPLAVAAEAALAHPSAAAEEAAPPSA